MDFGEPIDCPHCHGEGFIITCVDDLCHGAGYCMHGDGEADCPECGGTGELWDEDDDYYDPEDDYPEVTDAN